MKISILALTVATVFVQTSWCAPTGAVDSDPVAVSTIVPPVPSATPVVAAPAPPPVRKFTPEEQEEIESDLQGMEDRAVLEDMVQNGWPRQEAEMVLGLFDAVDTMTDDDIANPEEYDAVDEIRNSMSQLLSRVGYEYDDATENIGGVSNGRKVFSRVMAPASAEAAAPHAYTRQSMTDVVHGLTNLVRSASKLAPFLGNPALAQYAKMLTTAADMIETVVRSTKNFIGATPRI